MIERAAPQAITFLVSIVIARVVEPAAYGLIGMLGIFMALGAAFTDLAFSAALVQKKTITDDDETSVFYVNIAAGVVLTLILCAISPMVAGFFRQKILVSLLCAQSFTVLISSFGIVQLALITRSMSFKVNAMIELISCALSGGVGIGMAWCGYGVWSLVGLNLARAVFSVALLWIVRDWRPRGRFCMLSVRSMWSFSGKLLYASLIHRVVTNLYTVVIGRVYPPADLGLYTRANSFQALPVGLLTGIVQRVAFPLFSRHQDDPAFLLAAIRRQNRILIFFATIVLTILAVISNEFIPLLIGSKWDGAVPLMKILCLGGVFACAFPLHSEMVKALGKSSLFFRIEMMKKVTIVIVIFSLYRYGIYALAWGAALISVSDYLLSAWPNVKLIGYRWRMQALDVLSPLLLCSISVALVMCVKWQVFGSPLAILASKLVLLAVVIMAGTIAFRHTLFADVWEVAVLSSRKLLRLKSKSSVYVLDPPL